MNLLTLNQKLLKQLIAAKPNHFHHSIKLGFKLWTDKNRNNITYEMFIIYYKEKDTFLKPGHNENEYFSLKNTSLKKLIAQFNDKLLEINNYNPEIVEEPTTDAGHTEPVEVPQ